MTVSLTEVFFDDFDDGSTSGLRLRTTSLGATPATISESGTELLMDVAAGPNGQHPWPFGYTPVLAYINPATDIPVFAANGWTMDSFPGMWECKVTNEADAAGAGSEGAGLFSAPGDLLKGSRLCVRGSRCTWYKVNDGGDQDADTASPAPSTTPHIYQCYFVPSGWGSSVDFPDPNGSGSFTVAAGQHSMWFSKNNGSSFTQMGGGTPSRPLGYIPTRCGVCLVTSWGADPGDDSEFDWFRYSLAGTGNIFGSQVNDEAPSLSDQPDVRWSEDTLPHITETTEQDPEFE